MEDPSLYRTILDARRRIAAGTLTTPLLHSHHLSERVGGRVLLKMESEQHTGSFKARGALNKLACLEERGRRGPVVTASSGNHGLGVARALRLLAREGVVVVPENVDPAKAEALRYYGTRVEVRGRDCVAAEAWARKRADEEGWEYVSPYNDLDVIAGQGTVALEIVEQLGAAPDNVFVTVGGGGLVSGVGACLKAVRPDIHVVGCQPEASPEMALSVRSGSYTTVPERETLSDASAGAFEEGSVTFDLCRTLVDEFLLVNEEEIADALRLVLARERKLVEGSAAVAVAALLREPRRWRGQTSVVVVCGGNVSVDRLRGLLCSGRPG
jgi:threonine dehydratase